jgi:4-methyl-5(b-hydroxyethyl)-thiazole monophosphate biosynthesis
VARVLLPLAEGFEEIEAVTVVDLLRRAGIEVRTASLAGTRVTGSHGITVEADIPLDAVDATEYDMIVLPGGMPGAEHLKNDARVVALLRRFASEGRYTAAICAAPGVLAHAGLLDGRQATSFPGFLRDDSAPGLKLSAAPVVVDGKVVTSRGPGTAIEFSLALIELLLGTQAADAVGGRLQGGQRKGGAGPAAAASGGPAGP